jgi:hypothetical protein
MSSISEGFVLRKVTSFTATMGLTLATIANLPHSASAANRGGLWVVVHDICVPAYQSIGVGQTMSRELHAMDYRKLFARPRHYAKADTDARRLFKAPTGC